MKRLFLLTLLISTGVAFGAGGEGHGSIKDLMYPAINFVILFGFLIWKLAKPISKSFTENAKSVEELFNHAEEKDKEAQAKYNEYKQKLDHVESHSNRLMDETNAEVSKFDNDHVKEVAESIQRLGKESKDKLEHEKSALLQDVNNQLLDLVVMKAKETVVGNKDSQKKITSNLLSQI